MMTNTEWEGVGVLIPRRFHDARRTFMASARLDHAALIEALPVAPPFAADPILSAFLAEVDTDDCRAWINRVLHALPTQADMEAEDGDA